MNRYKSFIGLIGLEIYCLLIDKLPKVVGGGTRFRRNARVAVTKNHFLDCFASCFWPLGGRARERGGPRVRVIILINMVVMAAD